MSTLNPYYVVITNKQNKDQIVSEFTSGANALNRVVTITKPMPLSDHNIEALLTQAEADILKTDSRMIDVHLDPEEFLGIVEGNMISILTKAIQELSAQVTTLQSQVAALQAKVGA